MTESTATLEMTGSVEADRFVEEITGRIVDQDFSPQEIAYIIDSLFERFLVGA